MLQTKKVKKMVRLTQKQVDDKLNFIDNYIHASNAATGASVDANANVATKTVATLGIEVHKDFNIQINRQAMYEKISDIFDEYTAADYLEMLEDHLIYKNDETCQTPGTPYCVAISMYPFLLHGMTNLGGESKAPKHLDSFCGSFINLIFAIGSQFAGAVATVEFLMYFDYFARKDYGPDYLKTHKSEVSSKLQHVIYSLNQPAASRGYQSVFWNISVFDKYFFDAVFTGFVYPDEELTPPCWESINELQFYFLEWIMEERRKALLTFPVITEASLNDPINKVPKDQEFAERIAELRSRGLSLFSYNNENPAAISSCCRLSSKITDMQSDEKFLITIGDETRTVSETDTVIADGQKITISELFEKQNEIENIYWN